MTLKSECESHEYSAGEGKADVDDVTKRPSMQLCELRRDEGSTHRPNAVDGVHDAHLGGRVPGQTGKESISPCVLTKGYRITRRPNGRDMGGVRRDTHEKRCAEPYEEEADGKRWEWRSGGLERITDGDDE